MAQRLITIEKYLDGMLESSNMELCEIFQDKTGEFIYEIEDDLSSDKIYLTDSSTLIFNYYRGKAITFLKLVQGR